MTKDMDTSIIRFAIGLKGFPSFVGPTLKGAAGQLDSLSSVSEAIGYWLNFSTNGGVSLYAHSHRFLHDWLVACPASNFPPSGIFGGRLTALC
jgi:hypothetical protein